MSFGQGVLAGIGSAFVTLLGLYLTFRQRRQDREDRIAERVYARLEAENKDLRARVTKAEALSGRAIVIEMGLRLMVQGALRAHHSERELSQLAVLLRALPAPQNTPEFDDLLKQIDERDRD